MAESVCSYCDEAFPLASSCCPHCGRPSLFPNVTAAEGERSALYTRYRAALERLAARGLDRVAADFERTVASDSRAVVSFSLGELERLAQSDREPFRRHHQLVRVEARLPSGSKWDVLRSVAEEALFPGYKAEINFCALTLTSDGVTSYGECSVTLRTDRIAHRATVYEANNVVHSVFQRGLTMADAAAMPRGCRALWEDRGRLAVTKLCDKIDDSTAPADYAGLLITTGRSTDDDDFIEVHVFGPMTIRTVQRARVVRSRGRPRVRLKALRQDLGALGIDLET